MQAELAAGRADIAAASLTSTPEWTSRRRCRRALHAHSAARRLSAQRRRAARARCSWNPRSSRCAPAVRRSASCEHLKSTVAPTLQWVETAPSVADPLEDVDSRRARTTRIIDEREFSFAHHLYPNVLVGFALPERRPVQWIVRRGAPGAAGERQSLLPRAGRLRAPAADACRNPPETRARSRTRSRASFRGTSPSGCRSFAPGSRRPRRSRASTGGCWRRSATRNRSGIRAPPPATARVGVMMLTADTAAGHGHQGSHQPASRASPPARATWPRCAR